MSLNLDPALFASNLIQKEPTLIETEDGDVEKCFDMHTSATAIVYVAADDPSNTTANNNCVALANVEDPSVDVGKLMRQIRNSDRAAALRLIALVKGGLDKLADNAFDNKQ